MKNSGIVTTRRQNIKYLYLQGSRSLLLLVLMVIAIWAHGSFYNTKAVSPMARSAQMAFTLCSIHAGSQSGCIRNEPVNVSVMSLPLKRSQHEPANGILSCGSCISKSSKSQNSSASSKSPTLNRGQASRSVLSPSFGLGADEDPPDDDKPVDYSRKMGSHYKEYSALSQPSSSGDRLRSLQSLRMRVDGVDSVGSRLAQGGCFQSLVGPRDNPAPGEAEILARAETQGIRVRLLSDNQLVRLGILSSPNRVAGCVGRLNCESPQELFTRLIRLEAMPTPPVIWLLAGLIYPTNIGAIIRTAEISGMAGVIVCGIPESFRRINWVARDTQWFIPVLYVSMTPRDVVEQGVDAGLHVVAIETSGQTSAGSINWRMPTLALVGGEQEGIPDDALTLCHEIICLPSLGFMYCYNVQVSMAMVTGVILENFLTEFRH